MYSDSRASRDNVNDSAHIVSEGLGSGKIAYTTLIIDLANAKGGDVLNFGYTTTFDDPSTGEHVEDSLYIGTSFSTNATVPAKTDDGTIIGSLTVRKGSYATITFNDNVNNISSGTAKVKTQARIHNQYNGEELKTTFVPLDLPVVFSSWTGKRDHLTAKNVRELTQTQTGFTEHFNAVTMETTVRRVAIYNARTSDIETTERGSFLKNAKFEAPVGAEFEVTLAPDNAAGNVSWTLIPDNVTASYYFKKFENDVPAKNDVNKKLDSITLDEINTLPGVHVNTVLTTEKGAVKATVTGTPANYKPYVEFRTKSGAKYIGVTGIPAPGKRMNVAVDGYKALNELGKKGRNGEKISNLLNALNALPGFGAGDISTYTLAVDADAKIKGHVGDESGLSINTPARGMLGKKGEFVFTVKNTGTFPALAPNVTLPDGSVITIDKLEEYGNKTVGAGVGKTVKLTVPYTVPADATEATFSITYPGFNVNGTGTDTFTQTFYFTDKKSANELIEEGNKEQGKKLDEIAKSIKDGNENTNKNLKDINGELEKIGNDTKRQADELDKIRKESEKQTTALDKIKDNTKTLSDEAKKQAEYLKGIDGDLDTINAEVTKHTTALNTLADQSKKQTDNLGKINAALKELGKKYDTLNDTQKKKYEQLKKQADELAKQTDELARQTAELKRQSDSQAMIVNQLKRLADQQDVAAGNEKHRDYVGRCLATNSGFAVSLILPIAAAIAGSNPGVQDMFNSASRNISDMLGASSNPAVVDFNNRYGGMIQAGLQGIGGILAVLATAGAITGFINDCYQKADEETGRDIIDRPTMSSELEWIGTPDHNKNGFAPAANKNTPAETTEPADK